jgi:hypothetical protein
MPKHEHAVDLAIAVALLASGATVETHKPPRRLRGSPRAADGIDPMNTMAVTDEDRIVRAELTWLVAWESAGPSRWSMCGCSATGGSRR